MRRHVHVAVEEEHDADEEQADRRQLPRARRAKSNGVEHRGRQVISGNRLRDA
jgi:hypothetical protein